MGETASSLVPMQWEGDTSDDKKKRWKEGNTEEEELEEGQKTLAKLRNGFTDHELNTSSADS